MRVLGTIAFVLALCSPVHAGDKVDWSQYIDKNPSAPMPAKKPAAAQPARPAAKTVTKAKPTTAKPAASAKTKPRHK